MSDEFDYIAIVVFTDDTFRYGFNEPTLEIFGVDTPEEAAVTLCPRKDPEEVIIV